MSAGQRVAAGTVTVLLALVTAVLSAWRIPVADGAAGLRLSWRAEPIRVEECRVLTEEELAAIPAHMRRAEECVGDSVDYELRVTIDGRAEAVDTVSPSGLRRDRPVYVLRDMVVPAGVHSVEVRFTALVPEGFEQTDRPVRLVWSDQVDLPPGEVALVTLDEAGRALIRRGGGP